MVKIEPHGCYFLLLTFQYSEAKTLLTLAGPLSFPFTVPFPHTPFSIYICVYPSLFMHAVLSFSVRPAHMSLVTPWSDRSPGAYKETWDTGPGWRVDVALIHSQKHVWICSKCLVNIWIPSWWRTRAICMFFSMLLTYTIKIVVRRQKCFLEILEHLEIWHEIKYDPNTITLVMSVIGYA